MCAGNYTFIMLRQPPFFLLLTWFLFQQCLLTVCYAGDNIHDAYNRPVGFPSKRANASAPIKNWIRALPLLHQGLYFGKRDIADEFNDFQEDDDDKEFRLSTLGHITSKRNPRLTSFMMGKRDPRFSDFMMGKRDPRFSDFMMGKRDPRFSDFIMGKRDPRFSDFMMGKRDPRLSDFMMGKRDSRLSDFMLGKRDPRFSDFIMGKRDPRLSDFMMGKRDARMTDFMLGKRDARLSDFMMGRRELGFDEDENEKQTGHNYFQNEVDHRYALHGGDLETIEGSRGNVIYDDTDIPNQAEAAEFQDLESSSSLKRGKVKLHRPQFKGAGKTPAKLWSNLGSGKRSSSVDYEDEDENVITEIKRSADPNPKTSVRRFPPAALHKGLYFGKRAANWEDM